MALDDTKTLAERILRLEQKLQRLEKREGRPPVELFDNSAIRNRKIIDDLLVHNHTHANLLGLDADDHTQYLNTTRHDSTTRHTLGTVVPHDSHSSLSNLSNDDHTQYLNTTRHDSTTRHTLGTVVPHDDHGSLSGLSDDDHTQYLNTTRHDSTARHTLGTVVPHDDHGSLTGLADDDHTQYLNISRHDTTSRHTLGTIVPHDDHGLLSGLADDDHPKYTLAISSSTDNGIPRFDGTDGRTFQSSLASIDDDGGIVARLNNNGQISIGSDTNGAIEIGKQGRSSAGNPYIDFHSSANSPDYDARIIVNGGSSTLGQGTLTINAATTKISNKLNLNSYDAGEWQSWSPTMTGWSSYTVFAQYAVVGKICFFIIYMGAGTSNSTTSRISLPIQASSGLGKSGAIGWAMNNGAEITTACRWVISGAASVIELYTNMASGAWASSGTKRVVLEGFYERA